MANADYQRSLETQLSASEAMVHIATVSEWWTRSFTGQAGHAGDTFSVYFGKTFVDFEVTERLPDEKVVWRVMRSSLPWLMDHNEWTGTEVIWELSPAGAKTRISMTHRGLVPQAECFGRCEAGWNFFVGESLLGLLDHNLGMPDRQVR